MVDGEIKPPNRVRNRIGQEQSKMLSANKLGYYLWKRINQDQEKLARTRPMNLYGLYINQSDLNEYIRDYFNYGVDWDDTSKEELWERRYWDEKDNDI